MNTLIEIDASELEKRNAAGDGQFREGPVAKAIEQQTAKLPSDLFLWAAGAAALVSLESQPHIFTVTADLEHSHARPGNLSRR